MEWAGGPGTSDQRREVFRTSCSCVGGARKELYLNVSYWAHRLRSERVLCTRQGASTWSVCDLLSSSLTWVEVSLPFHGGGDRPRVVLGAGGKAVEPRQLDGRARVLSALCGLVSPPPAPRYPSLRSGAGRGAEAQQQFCSGF